MDFYVKKTQTAGTGLSEMQKKTWIISITFFRKNDQPYIHTTKQQEQFQEICAGWITPISNYNKSVDLMKYAVAQHCIQLLCAAIILSLKKNNKILKPESTDKM